MQRQVRQLIAGAAILGAASSLAACATTGAGRGSASWRREAPEFVASARIAGDAAVQLARPAALAVEVHTRAGFHLNAEYPHRFTPTVGLDPSVAYGEASPQAAPLELAPCEGAPGASCALRLVVPFSVRAAAAGGHTVGGELAFGACDAERCLIEKLPIAVAIAVESGP